MHITKKASIGFYLLLFSASSTFCMESEQVDFPKSPKMVRFDDKLNQITVFEPMHHTIPHPHALFKMWLKTLDARLIELGGEAPPTLEQAKEKSYKQLFYLLVPGTFIQKHPEKLPEVTLGLLNDVRQLLEIRLTCMSMLLRHLKSKGSSLNAAEVTQYQLDCTTLCELHHRKKIELSREQYTQELNS